MTEAKDFRSVLGGRVRERRQGLGLTQDEVAGRCRMVGFDATRSIVDSIERGVRQLELPELLVLLAVLGLSLEEVLESAGRVALDDGRSVEGSTLARQLSEPAGAWNVSRGGVSFAVSPAKGSMGGFASAGTFKEFGGFFSDAEMKAARKLRVKPAAVADAAEQLWGCSLTFERDRRVFEQQPENASPRSVQAIRGHVTRVLLMELETALEGGS